MCVWERGEEREEGRREMRGRHDHTSLGKVLHCLCTEVIIIMLLGPKTSIDIIWPSLSTILFSTIQKSAPQCPYMLIVMSLHACMISLHACMMSLHAFDVLTCLYDVLTCLCDVLTWPRDVLTCPCDVFTCSCDVLTCLCDVVVSWAFSFAFCDLAFKYFR